MQMLGLGDLWFSCVDSPAPIAEEPAPALPAAPRATFASARVHLGGLNELQGLGNECA